METYVLEGFDVVGSITPLLTSAMTQIVGLVTAIMPYVIGVSLFGAGIYLVKSFISKGATSVNV